MRKLRKILHLKDLGLRHRDIGRTCGIGAGTVSRYLARAQAAGLAWPLPEDLDDAALEARVFTHPPPSGVPRPRPDPVQLHQERKRPGVTLALLWQEYRAVHPHGYSYSQFCDIYRRWSKTLKPAMRQVHRAGEKLFVDFAGQHPHLVEASTGEVKPVELFVGVLGASSYTYAEATCSQDLPTWLAAHARMLEFFGGSSALWVPDNLKSGVTTACRYEAEVNRTYQEMADHYGAAVIPARVRRPKDAGTTKQISVTFSKDMQDGSWSWAKVSDETFPKIIGSPRYLPDKRTCVVNVELEANRTYVIWLNSQELWNFKDTKKQSAVPYLLVFKTK